MHRVPVAMSVYQLWEGEGSATSILRLDLDTALQSLQSAWLRHAPDMTDWVPSAGDKLARMRHVPPLVARSA